MDVDQDSLDRVESKINKQSAISACFGATLWSIPTLVIWFLIYSFFPQFSTMMLIVSGLLMGLSVRIHGRGLSALFSIIGFVAHAWISFVALALNIVINGTTWGIILFGCYAVGAGFSISLSRINIQFEDHRAHSYLNNKNKYLIKLYNKWFVILPLLLVGLLITSSLTSLGLEIFKESQQIEYEQKLRDKITDKEIDMNPASLDSMKAKDILMYAYAYHTGLLFNANGSGSQPFNKSDYKAKTLLKYLVKERNNARAKFIYGKLEKNSIGNMYIQEAAEQGDSYAQVYSILDYGCFTDPDKAKLLFHDLNNSSRQQYIKDEIESILYIDFPEICDFNDEPEILLSHIINYKG